jgi:hypothetical protein
LVLHQNRKRVINCDQSILIDQLRAEIVLLEAKVVASEAKVALLEAEIASLKRIHVTLPDRRRLTLLSHQSWLMIRHQALVRNVKPADRKVMNDIFARSFHLNKLIKSSTLNSMFVPLAAVNYLKQPNLQKLFSK